MIFKSLDDSFSGVAAVAVGRKQLVLNVIASEKVFLSGRCLVV
jgi:hypothetical protein